MKMFDAKNPKETIVITFDYSANGATEANPVTGYVVTIRTIKGVDQTPGLMLNGAPMLVDGNKVLQEVIGGVNGCYYQLDCLGSIGGNGRPIVQGILPVSTNCGIE